MSATCANGSNPAGVTETCSTCGCSLGKSRREGNACIRYKSIVNRCAPFLMLCLRSTSGMVSGSLVSNLEELAHAQFEAGEGHWSHDDAEEDEVYEVG